MALRATRSRTRVTATGTGNVSVATGQSKTCILTNDDNEAPPPENGTITVEKQLIPDGYQPPQGGFVFTGAINATLGDGQSKTVEVEPGTHTVTESLDGAPVLGSRFRSSALTATRPAISGRSRRRTRSPQASTSPASSPIRSAASSSSRR